MENFKNGDTFQLEAVLRKCAGKGNVPTSLATGHNLQRLAKSNKPVRERLTDDPEMDYHVRNIDLANEVSTFDTELYNAGLDVARLDADVGLDSDHAAALTYYNRYIDRIDGITNFDVARYEAGKAKVDELMGEPNDDFVPYRYNMAKISDDLGDERLNASLTTVLIAFGQEEDGS